jgi:hypothetical protein
MCSKIPIFRLSSVLKCQTVREKAGVASGDYVSVNTDFVQDASGCRTVPYTVPYFI